MSRARPAPAAEIRPPARFPSRSAAETESLGASLAPHLEIGDVLALEGPLGAGKTCFVAGLARGLGAGTRVRSPSFTLVNEYHGRLPLLHVDLYRLGPAEADALGLEEQVERGVLAVEWGEKLPARLWERSLVVEFEILSETGRGIGARPAAPRVPASRGRAAALLAAWRGGATHGAGKGPER